MNVLYFSIQSQTTWDKSSGPTDMIELASDMMINTFQQQKQMWAMHFHNKHNLGQTHLNF